MKTRKRSFTLASTLLLAAGTFTGCESTDNGSTQVSGSVYYGVGFYDTYYHGHYDDDHDVIVTPPSPGSPPGAIPPPAQGTRPSQPIARPPARSATFTTDRAAAGHVLKTTDCFAETVRRSPRPAARPTPSIPSTPRAAPRGGGGGRR
jgi:hypothetical protein